MAILVFTAVMQIKYVNRALQRFDATQVIPTQFVLFTLCVILGSAVLYRDFEKTPGEDAGKFIGGCALTFIGVWLITSARPSPSDEGSEFDDEDDEAIALRAGEQFPEEFHINGSQSSIKHSVVESEDDVESQRRPSSVRGNHNKTSPPQSPEYNNWDSVLESTSTTPGRPSISGLETARSESLLDVSPMEENPWHSRSQSQGLKPKSSFRRLLEPFTSLFPSQAPETILSTPEARHSAPDIPSGIESSATTPRTRASSYHDDEVHVILGTSLPNHHDHQHALPRNSLSSLYPGPFTSPLSSSLSAVVADSIRRRVRLQPRRSTRSRLLNLPDEAARPTRSRGNSEPVDSQAAQAAVLEHALRSPLGGATPSRRRGNDEELDDVNADEDFESEPSTPNPGRRKSLGERLGGIFRSRRVRLATSTRHSDEQGTLASSSAEEQV